MFQIGQNRVAQHILSQQSKIMETVKMSPTAAKKYYIILWQHIEEAGLAYFQVVFKKDSKKEEYAALSSEKIMRLGMENNFEQKFDSKSKKSDAYF